MPPFLGNEIMNANLFRLVFNKALGMLVPVHEAARSRGKGGGVGGERDVVGRHTHAAADVDAGKGLPTCAVMAALLVSLPAMAQLPVACGGGACGVNPNPVNFVTSGAAGYAINGTQGIVTQTTDKAILNWQSFNVGAGYSMVFNQPGANSAALNRIWQGNASVIAGAIQANGQIYLINQNGILFANGAQVNVGGLVASALDIDDAVFLHPNGLFSLTDEAGNVRPAFQWTGTAEGFAGSLVKVEPDAELAAALGGAIMLFAPQVVNQGTIHTREGQAVLAAGGKIYLSAPPGSEGLPENSPFRGLAGMLVEVDPFVDPADSSVKLSGTVLNDTLGQIIAERGNATLVALAVNQMGRVTATSSVNYKGSVRLLAREKAAYDPAFTAEKVLSATDTGEAVLGENSVTEVLPELESSQTITDGQVFNPSTVEVAGGSVTMGKNASIVAPGGHVTLSAQELGTLFAGGDGSDNGHRIYMAEGSLIDVSGLTDVELDMARNFIEVELRGTELRDNPLNRDGYLRGKKVWVDIRNLPDPELADVSGYVNQIGRGIGEKLSAGGTVTMRSEGDIVQRQGSVIDISGGSLAYNGGYGYASQLVSQGQAFNIGDAPADRIYDGIVGLYTYTDPKWGVTTTVRMPLTMQYYDGYVQGQNAGTLNMVARAYALDGELVAQTVTGPYQRQAPNADGSAPALDQLPAAGTLVIGDASQAGVTGGDMKTPDVLLSSTYTALPEGFDANSSLPSGYWDGFVLSTQKLNDSGVGHIAVYSNGSITVAEDGALNLPAFGSLTLAGEKVAVNADIVTPGGAINLVSQQTATTTDFADTGVTVGEGVTLSVAGLWTNDALPDSDFSAPVVLNGGNIAIRSVSGVNLEAGSVLDADGGAWYTSARKLKGGKGGNIDIAAADSAPVLNGELRAWGMSQGGTLKLKAPALTVGTAARGVWGELVLDPGYFSGKGFGAYVLEGVNSVSVEDGAQVSPYQTNLVLNPDFAIRESGQDMDAFSHREILPDHLRKAVNFTLKASSKEAYLPLDGSKAGWLTVGEGAAIELEAGGILDLTAANHQLQVLGRLAAPAGEIRLTMLGDPSQPGDPGYDAAQAIWIGDNAELLAPGAVIYTPNASGLIEGRVLDAGKVTMKAQKGYVVAKSGALIDVSGVAAELDIATPAAQGFTYSRKTVAGAGGAINIAAREGMVLNAAMNATAAPGGIGGSLTLTLDRGSMPPQEVLPIYPGASNRLGSNDPGRRWNIVVGDSYGGLADGLAPGDSIDAAAPGEVRMGAQQVADAGFASLELNAEHGIAFEGDVDVNLDRVLVLNAPAIESDGGSVNLSAAYAGLGNTTNYAQRQVQQAAVAGLGDLNVSAQHIDLNGFLSLQGFDGVNLTSAGDIRAVGVIPSSSAPYPAGGLAATGTVTFTARQVYPATLTDYAIDVQGAGGKAVFAGNGVPSPVLSAAGKLVVQAETIEQGGVIKAPMGEIVLAADDTLTLMPGSLTSVSAEGQVIPFGGTVLTGRRWVYTVNGLSRELAAPEKAVELSAPAVEVAEGATVDVSGGGDLAAYEWIPGLGGSEDVLAAADFPDTYAILPGYNSAFAPLDHQYMDGATLPLAGESVYLSGVPNLAAGYYTLLPARYALLPGAFAVTALPGHADMVPSQNTVRVDGAAVVAGQSAVMLADGSLVDVGRRGGYLVESGSLVRQRSQYLTTLASDFYKDTVYRLPGDAGRVSIEAATSLVFEGALAASHAEAYLGAMVDLSAPRLAVVSDDATALPGYLTLSVDMLNALGAESLLLGGVRRQTELGTWVSVGSEEVLLANDAAHPLQGPEVMLAARDAATLADGSAINSTGAASTSERRLTIGYSASPLLDINGDGSVNDADGAALGSDLNYDGLKNLDDVAISALGAGYDYKTADGSPRQANRNDLAAAFAIGDLNGDRRIDLADLDGVDGDGALVAVASAGGLEVVRQNTDSDRGVLNAAANALIGGYAVILDATKDNLSAAKPVVAEGGQLTIGAGRISFGAMPSGTPGLTLADDALKDLLGSVGDLVLRSYTTLDIHGDLDMQQMLAELRLENPALEAPHLRLQAAGIAGYGGDAVLQASVLELNNVSGAAFSAPTLSDGTVLTPGAGSLTLLGDEVRLGDGAFRIAGYTDAGIRAGSGIVAAGTGSLNTDGNLTLAGPRIAAMDGAVYVFDAGGDLKTEKLDSLPGAEPAAAGIIASLSFMGENVEHGGVVEAPVGEVSFLARSGDVKLLAGSEVLAQGRTADIFDEKVALPGGTVRMESASGNVITEAGSMVDVSAAGADAGRVEVAAVNGYFRSEGQLLGEAAALLNAEGETIADAGRGGVFRMDVLSLHDAGATGSGDDFSAVNAALGSGFGGERNIRVRSGDIVVAATDTVGAQKVYLSADAGAIDVYGTLDASGAKGGEVGLFASGDVTLRSGAELLARGLADTESAAGTAGRGGTVILSSESGSLGTEAGSLIDVSGDQAGDVMGMDGRVHLRAARNAAGNDLAIAALDGEITGAREILAEAVKVYSGYAKIDKGTSSGTKLGFNTVNSENNAFMADAAGIATRLGMDGNAAFRVTPGVEVRSDGNLEVTSDWNLWWSASTVGTSAVRSNKPMVLTLRAAGDLDIKGSINDAFWAGKMTGLTTETLRPLSDHVLKSGPSSSYNLAAGADMAAANPFAVVEGAGDFSLAAGKFIRTGTGEIRIASGGDVQLKGSDSVIYTAGTPAPAVDGFNNPQATLKPSYTNGGGDILISALGDIVAAAPVETAAAPAITQWLFRHAQNRIVGGVKQTYPNPQTTWWVRYDKFRQGIGTLGGGDISVEGGGDIVNLWLSAPTNARLGGDRLAEPDPANLVVLGGGDIRVDAGGDVTNGLVYVAMGEAEIEAGGNLDQRIAMQDGQVQASALGSVAINEVFDPMVTAQNREGGLQGNNANAFEFYFHDYAAAASVEALSVTDSVTLASMNSRVYPGTLKAYALSGDILVQDALTLYPSAEGQLVLAAGGSVGIDKLLVMSDYAPENIPGLLDPVITTSAIPSLGGYQDYRSHDPSLLHLNDEEAVRIYALAGDVAGTSASANLVTPKPAIVQAGRDVRDLSMVIQNLAADDISRISAGRDVRLPDGFDLSTGNVGANSASIEIGGPGYLMVLAGRDVDLGSSKGLLSVGNEYNTYLDAQGADMMILAGLGMKDGQPRLPAYQTFADRYLAPDSEALTDLYAEFGYRARKDTAVQVLADHPELDPADPADLAAIEAYLDGEYAVQVLARKNELWSGFHAMPLEAQVTRVFFNELQEAGKDFNEAIGERSAEDAQRGYDAVAALFPSTDASQPVSYAGDVNFYFSQVRSNRGGDVEIFAPGGLVNVGLASSGKLSKSEAELGLFTIRGGDIRAYVHDDFLVNQSRVFTLGGGDILLWSDEGDIDAGKGAKTAAAAPPPQLRVEGGRIFFDISGSVSGSGIAGLNTSRGNPRDDGYLIAPNGEINAGDAGIRSAGNLSIAAIRVVGADNIQVGGISTGVPVSDTGGLAAGLSGTSGLADAGGGDGAAKALSDSASSAEKAAQLAKEALAGFAPSFITVDILGFGCEGDDKNCDSRGI